MQIDPIKSKLKFPGTKRLKPNCDVPLTTSGFKFHLRRYDKKAAAPTPGELAVKDVVDALLADAPKVGPGRN